MRQRLLFVALALALALLLDAGAHAAPADRLRPDQVAAHYPLGEGPPGRYGEQGRRVARLIQNELGFDVRAVPVYIVDGQTLEQMLRAAGSRVGFHFTLEGLELDGKVYVRERLGSVDDATLIHEVIHVLSMRFASEANGVGLHSLVEGLTEAMAQRVAPPKRQSSTDLVRRRRPGYVGYTRFAHALADLIGEARLRTCFFSLGLAALAREVDAKLGAGAFAKAARLLERGDVRPAIAMLER
ncbi:MAG TPA: hypothetical protein VKN99_18655 [Polyangia bacterium]|nr:hypothetical protein [Polyangia bacterium]